MMEKIAGGGNDGPITFTVEDQNGVITSYTIPHSMTWEEFINSNLNETKTDIYGHEYKQFVLKTIYGDAPCYANLYDGEYDIDLPIEYKDNRYNVAKDELIKSTQYISD